MSARDMRAVFAGLPPEARARLRSRLGLPPCRRRDLWRTLLAGGHSATDAVVALAGEPAEWASEAIAAIAGRPIERLPPRPPLPHKVWRTPPPGPDDRRVVAVTPRACAISSPMVQRYALLRPGMTVRAYAGRIGNRWRALRDLRDWAREGSVVLEELR